MITTTLPASTGPRAPQLDRPTAMRLAAGEYDRFLEMLRGLTDADWARPTDCPAWDVRALATHVLGMAEMAASVRENLRQTRAARRQGGVFIDALTSLQVASRTGLPPAQVLSRFARMAPRAARGRRRTPGLVRCRTMPRYQVEPWDEQWALGYLIDVILTRDVWMHRIDVSRATGAPLRLSAGHDGVIVADVAQEWAGRHGQPCTLTLTGPAGGTWSAGEGGPALSLDAVEFCRALSGRTPGDGLLAVQVPF